MHESYCVLQIKDRQEEPQDVSIKEAVHAWNFIKKRFQHKRFSVNTAKFLRTLLFEAHLRTGASGWGFIVT